MMLLAIGSELKADLSCASFMERFTIKPPRLCAMKMILRVSYEDKFIAIRDHCVHAVRVSALR